MVDWIKLNKYVSFSLDFFFLKSIFYFHLQTLITLVEFQTQREHVSHRTWIRSLLWRITKIYPFIADPNTRRSILLQSLQMQRRYLSSQWLKAGHVRGRKNRRLLLPSFLPSTVSGRPISPPSFRPPFLSARENFKCKFSEDERNFQVKWTTGFESFFEKRKKSNSLFWRGGGVKNQFGVLRLLYTSS